MAGLRLLLVFLSAMSSAESMGWGQQKGRSWGWSASQWRPSHNTQPAQVIFALRSTEVRAPRSRRGKGNTAAGTKIAHMGARGNILGHLQIPHHPIHGADTARRKKRNPGAGSLTAKTDSKRNCRCSRQRRQPGKLQLKRTNWCKKWKAKWPPYSKTCWHSSASFQEPEHNLTTSPGLQRTRTKVRTKWRTSHWRQQKRWPFSTRLGPMKVWKSAISGPSLKAALPRKTWKGWKCCFVTFTEEGISLGLQPPLCPRSWPDWKHRWKNSLSHEGRLPV